MSEITNSILESELPTPDTTVDEYTDLETRLIKRLGEGLVEIYHKNYGVYTTSSFGALRLSRYVGFDRASLYVSDRFVGHVRASKIAPALVEAEIKLVDYLRSRV